MNKVFASLILFLLGKNNNKTIETSTQNIPLSDEERTVIHVLKSRGALHRVLIARGSGIPVPSIHDVLRQLESRGAIKRHLIGSEGLGCPVEVFGLVPSF